ncbi:MAG: hypothetical protein IT288_10280 [Bdellovibrionales bacterium]|nr:hypothetical protein [Bdellovibrionales bacterium]
MKIQDALLNYFRSVAGVVQAHLLILILVGCALLAFSCSDDVFLDEVLTLPSTGTSGYVASGDIFIVSGGTVSSAATPYPLHKITQWSKSGTYIRTIATSTAPTTTFFYGLDLDPTGANLFFTVENVDRVETVDLSTLVTTTHLLDANLTGATIRAMAVLSDGGMVVAESTTSIEKFNSSKTRVTTNFPLTVTANINTIKRISGGRFVVLISGNPDNPRVYNDNGTLATTISGIGCTTNCDPYDIAELPDGRFVVSVQAAAYNSLELFDSSFTYVGQLYKDTNVMLVPGALAVLESGNLMVCSTALNTCEEIQITGNSGTRVGSQAFISDASLMRQPTAVVVAP